jgi:hypothetical protein
VSSVFVGDFLPLSTDVLGKSIDGFLIDRRMSFAVTLGCIVSKSVLDSRAGRRSVTNVYRLLFWREVTKVK